MSVSTATPARSIGAIQSRSSLSARWCQLSVSVLGYPLEERLEGVHRGHVDAEGRGQLAGEVDRGQAVGRAVDPDHQVGDGFGVLVRHDGQGHVGVVDEVVGHAAEVEPGEPAGAPAADHEQVGIVLVRGVQQGVGRVTVEQRRHRCGGGVGQLGAPAVELGELAFVEVGELIGWQLGLRGDEHPGGDQLDTGSLGEIRRPSQRRLPSSTSRPPRRGTSS